MDAASFLALALRCAPDVHPATAQAIARVESSLNPWAIAVVGAELLRQPVNRSEALATAHALQSQGWNFSVGLAQINVRNFVPLGLTVRTAFEPCANLAALQTLLTDCFERAGSPHTTGRQTVLRRALSCYYSGDFATGFHHGYVDRVAAAGARASATATTGTSTDPVAPSTLHPPPSTHHQPPRTRKTAVALTAPARP